MKLLLDTHVLLWAAAGEGLSSSASDMISDPSNEPWFSAASVWEVAIKAALGRADFRIDVWIDASVFRRGLLDNGYQELAISGAHAASVATLPDLHRDPFDRLLVAQAISEGITLLTADQAVLAYPGPIVAA